MLSPRTATPKVTLAALSLAAITASAQDFPSKPIRIITASAGGGSDFAARVIAQAISEPLGQQVIVDNRANGIVAAEAVAKGPADGYAMTVGGSAHWIRPQFQKMPYDPVRDFATITLVSKDAFVLVVHPSVPVKSVKELLALAKARPGQLNYGTAGAGSTQHLATEAFAAAATIKLTHIPYKGSAPAITDLLAGESQVMINDVGLVMPHAKTGKLRAIAVTTLEPSALVPGLPPIATDVPGFEAVSMTGLWIAAKTPAAIVNKLNQEVVRALNRPDVKERFLKAGSEVVGNTPAQFDTIIKADIARTNKIIKDADIKTDL
jgi:tripartite-type tricarboxylate transporter receptor subunit TctC